MNALKMKLVISIALSLALSCSIAGATTLKTSQLAKVRMKGHHPTMHAIAIQHIKIETEGWLRDKVKEPSEPVLTTATGGSRKKGK